MDCLAYYIYLLSLEDDELELNRNLKRERRILRESYDPLYLNVTVFKKNFRLTKEAFEMILHELESEMPPEVKIIALTPKQKLCGLLRFLAEGSYQHGVGNDYGVGMAQSTLSKAISQILDILERIICPKWIVLEMTEVEKRKSKTDFYNKSGFPGVIMCVDGTHIKIFPPKDNKHLYYNRKGFYSINAMIIVDSEMRIRFIDARYPGCNHDAHIWGLSDAKTFFEEQYQRGEENEWILGDAGYALEPWLMRPFRSPAQGSQQSLFNKKHTKARNIVERSIGILKNRFRCLLGARQLHYSPQKCAQIINVCCALHNICLEYKIEDPEISEEYLEDSTDSESDDEHEDLATVRNDAATIRNRIANSF